MQAEDFRPFAEAYAARRRRRTGRAPAPETLRTKTSRLATAANLAGVESLESFGQLMESRGQVEKLLDTLTIRMSPGALRPYVYALKDFAEYAVAMRWLSESPMRNTDVPPSNPQPSIVVYSEEEIETILGAARAGGLRWWAFLTFLADSGRRVGEALGLRWEWFRFDQDQPFVELPWTKNGTQQYVPLGRRLREEVFTPEHVEKLRVWTEGGNPPQKAVEAFPFPWAYQTARVRFRTLCRRVDVPLRGFHNFRHTRATRLISEGAPMEAVSALLGHASVATTDRIYNHTNALSFAKWAE